MLENFQSFESTIADLMDVPLSDLAGYEDSLLDFGIDSVQIMSLVGLLEEVGVDVSFVEMAAKVDLPAWWQLIDSKRTEIV